MQAQFNGMDALACLSAIPLMLGCVLTSATFILCVTFFLFQNFGLIYNNCQQYGRAELLTVSKLDKVSLIMTADWLHYSAYYEMYFTAGGRLKEHKLNSLSNSFLCSIWVCWFESPSLIYLFILFKTKVETKLCICRWLEMKPTILEPFLWQQDVTLHFNPNSHFYVAHPY